jgi:hypothetical protein
MPRPCRVEPCRAHPGQWRLAWRDGTLSQDCYNRTRAEDILRRYDLYRLGTRGGNNPAGPPRSPLVSRNGLGRSQRPDTVRSCHVARQAEPECPANHSIATAAKLSRDLSHSVAG